MWPMLVGSTPKNNYGNKTAHPPFFSGSTPVIRISIALFIRRLQRRRASRRFLPTSSPLLTTLRWIRQTCNSPTAIYLPDTSLTAAAWRDATHADRLSYTLSPVIPLLAWPLRLRHLSNASTNSDRKYEICNSRILHLRNVWTGWTTCLTIMQLKDSWTRSPPLLRIGEPPTPRSRKSLTWSQNECGLLRGQIVLSQTGMVGKSFWRRHGRNAARGTGE